MAFRQPLPLHLTPLLFPRPWKNVLFSTLVSELCKVLSHDMAVYMKGFLSLLRHHHSTW